MAYLRRTCLGISALLDSMPGSEQWLAPSRLSCSMTKRASGVTWQLIITGCPVSTVLSVVAFEVSSIVLVVITVLRVWLLSRWTLLVWGENVVW